MTKHELPPDWVADAVFYQIFPERFANGDPDLDPPGTVPWDATPTRENFFGGDLIGIEAHLDHVIEVGANAIYLTPIFQADTNHRYDATDYFAIDPRLGSLEDFQRFLRSAHDRGIRVVLDAVLNHCGIGHWAFQDIVKSGADSRYINWFSVESLPVRSHPDPNYRTCSGCWYLPKWNAYNPEVRQHHFDVAEYWLAQGIDGWRLDVPYFINFPFWREFREVVRKTNSEAYIVAEEWRDPVPWLDGTLSDGAMNYTLTDQILGFTADRNVTATGAAQSLNALNDRIPESHRLAMLNLLGSHDTSRVMSRHKGEVQDALLAYALLMTAAGAPMIYYGDEVGLVGDNDPYCRGAMPWDPVYWNQSILDTVKWWIDLRHGSPELRRGTQKWSSISDDVLVVRRELGTDVSITIVNRGRYDLSIDEASLRGLGVSLEEYDLKFPPSSSGRPGMLPAREAGVLQKRGRG